MWLMKYTSSYISCKFVPLNFAWISNNKINKKIFTVIQAFSCIKPFQALSSIRKFWGNSIKVH